jgi:hypothetical protein
MKPLTTTKTSSTPPAVTAYLSNSAVESDAQDQTLEAGANSASTETNVRKPTVVSTEIDVRSPAVAPVERRHQNIPIVYVLGIVLIVLASGLALLWSFTAGNTNEARSSSSGSWSFEIPCAQFGESIRSTLSSIFLSEEANPYPDSVQFDSSRPETTEARGAESNVATNSAELDQDESSLDFTESAGTKTNKTKNPPTTHSGTTQTNFNYSTTVTTTGPDGVTRTETWNNADDNQPTALPQQNQITPPNSAAKSNCTSREIILTDGSRVTKCYSFEHYSELNTALFRLRSARTGLDFARSHVDSITNMQTQSSNPDFFQSSVDSARQRVSDLEKEIAELEKQVYTLAQRGT